MRRGSATALLGSIDVTAPDSRLLGALDALRDAPAEVAILCDVDGTLAPIVARPEDAALVPGARPVLASLRDQVRLLGFVSGRALADARAMVGLDGCAYAGNHGMEMQYPGGAPGLASGVERHLPAMHAFVERWPETRLAGDGVRLEDKGATLSFHARGAADPAAAAALLQQVAEDARKRNLIPRPGREVLEIRPGLRVDKGTATRALLARSGARRAVYFGDDWTDVDAWRALRALRDEGILDTALAVGVRSTEVPPAVHEQADHLVDGPAGVLAALRHLSGTDAPAR